MDLKEQREKMERALVTCQRIIKEWKIAKKVTPTEETAIASDIQLKEMRDNNRRMLTAIKDIVESRFPSLVPVFLAYCVRVSRRRRRRCFIMKILNPIYCHS
jgi:hypothetical protein